MIYFHKILPLIFSPVFIIILLIIFYFFFRKKIFIFLSLLLLIFFSNPIISKKLVNYIEIPYVLKKLGSFKEDSINIYEYGRLSFKAIKLADRVGWK